MHRRRPTETTENRPFRSRAQRSHRRRDPRRRRSLRLSVQAVTTFESSCSTQPHFGRWLFSAPPGNRTRAPPRSGGHLGANRASSRRTSGPHLIVSDRGRNRTCKHEALGLAAMPICVPGRKWRVRGSHPAVGAYEAPLSTGSPAACFSCRPRYRTGRTGPTNLRSVPGASWAPAAPAIPQ
jgi:hypothetical protein